MSVKKLIAVLSVLALVTLLGLVVASTAFAQTATPPAQATPTTPGNKLWAWGRGFGFRGGDWTTEFDAAAKALNLTPTQLFEQLHSGKSLSDIAQAQGVDLQAVQNALQTAQQQAMKDAINQAVKDGRLTRAQADWLLQGIDQGFIPRGRGFGAGPKMHGGMHGLGGRAPVSPSAPAPGTSG